MFRTKGVEKLKTNILYSVTIMPLWDDVEEYGTARQVIDDNIILHRKDVISFQDN